MRGTWFHPDQSGPMADVFRQLRRLVASVGTECLELVGVGICLVYFEDAPCVQGV